MVQLICQANIKVFKKDFKVNKNRKKKVMCKSWAISEQYGDFNELINSLFTEVIKILEELSVKCDFNDNRRRD